MDHANGWVQKTKFSPDRLSVHQFCTPHLDLHFLFLHNLKLNEHPLQKQFYLSLHHKYLILAKPALHVDDDLQGAYITKDKTATAQLFEKIVDGLGETGGRNNALASFMGGLLFRGVDPNKAYQLAVIANSNTKDKLSDDEVYKTCESMLDKELKRRNIDD